MGSICIDNELREKVEEKLKDANIKYEISDRGNSFQLSVDREYQDKCSSLIQETQKEMIQQRATNNSDRTQSYSADKTHQQESREVKEDPDKVRKEKLKDAAIRDDKAMHQRNQDDARKKTSKEQQKEEAKEAMDKEMGLTAKAIDFRVQHAGREVRQQQQTRGTDRTR